MYKRQALSRLFQKGNINFGSAKDIRGSLKRLEIGSTLGITELLQICALLDNTSRVKSYGRREKENEQRDSLDDLFDALEPLPLLNTEIRRCILSEDEIADDASATLKQIRRSMKVTGERIHTQLAGMVNGCLLYTSHHSLKPDGFHHLIFCHLQQSVTFHSYFLCFLTNYANCIIASFINQIIKSKSPAEFIL